MGGATLIRLDKFRFLAIGLLVLTSCQDPDIEGIQQGIVGASDGAGMPDNLLSLEPASATTLIGSIETTFDDPITVKLTSGNLPLGGRVAPSIRKP